mmetsp:Transcript_7648/g.14282  ORF Transcript_7648/g.14282 Transcript_7648/m.14282 type:complete len:288 (-) Transcript_7648:45-908(-)
MRSSTSSRRRLVHSRLNATQKDATWHRTAVSTWSASDHSAGSSRSSRSWSMAAQQCGAGTGRNFKRFPASSRMKLPNFDEAAYRPRQQRIYADYALSPKWAAGTASWLQPTDPISHSLDALSAAAVSPMRIVRPPLRPDYSPHPRWVPGTAKWLWPSDPLNLLQDSAAPRKHEPPLLLRNASDPSVREWRIQSRGKCSPPPQRQQFDHLPQESMGRNFSSGSTTASSASGDVRKDATLLTHSYPSRSRARTPPPSWKNQHWQQQRHQLDGPPQRVRSVSARSLGAWL